MALFKKKGRNVWIYQTKINGKSWCRSTGETSRKKAKAKVPELRKLAQLHRDAPDGSLKLGNSIVREVARIEADVSKRQADRVDCALRNFLDWAGDVSLERIDENLIEDFQRRRSKEVARSTVEKEICCIIKMLKENRIQIDKPKPKPGREALNRPFSQDELRRFFLHCPDELRSSFLLMLVTGARPAEIVPSIRSSHTCLLKKELDVKACTITIRCSKQLPNQKDRKRSLKVPQVLVGLLSEISRRTPGDFIFPPIKDLCRRFDRVLKAAGIEKTDALGQKLTAHSFRHTYATFMAEAVGHNPFVLKQVLGHSQISTTDRYCHPTASVPVIDISPFIAGGGGQKGWTQRKKGVLLSA